APIFRRVLSSDRLGSSNGRGLGAPMNNCVKERQDQIIQSHRDQHSLAKESGLSRARDAQRETEDDGRLARGGEAVSFDSSPSQVNTNCGYAVSRNADAYRQISFERGKVAPAPNQTRNSGVGRQSRAPRRRLARICVALRSILGGRAIWPRGILS